MGNQFPVVGQAHTVGEENSSSEHILSAFSILKFNLSTRLTFPQHDLREGTTAPTTARRYTTANEMRTH